MRSTICINDNWIFIKDNVGAEAAMSTAGQHVTLPHTWNAEDGQDGGNDYYRGTCWYAKRLPRPVMPDDGEAWLEFRGVAMTADVYVNGVHLGHHEGGYSTFRVNITDALTDNNTIVVSADNSRNLTVYPQKADFTFYGGIYRDVYLITVPKVHFALDYYGSPGIKVTPIVDGNNAKVKVESWTCGGDSVRYIMGQRVIDSEVRDGFSAAEFIIEDVRLWDGVFDPYLYSLKAELISNDSKADEVSVRFGCRTFSFDKDKGFFLNGRSYPLCGVARHQDRRGTGNALTPSMHREDMDIIREMGANTIRLAHYQHDQYFYDLADEYGLVVWAEIPYITEHMPEGRQNTLDQMRELVVQNYNHPSIICWGLSNEITVVTGVTEDLYENHRLLNDLCHELDATRPTVMAHAFMLEINDPIVTLPDIRSYNLYFGWYVGDVGNNDVWFDDFRKQNPEVVIGLSEYGADALIQYQTANPQKGDCTEQYQALYHEHMLRLWKERPYIWAMHVWNMFDFAADGRGDAGEPGVNHKGLVTFDRKTRKDAYYLYKAYLSGEPFVHVCGSRYVDRAEEITHVKVYSNQHDINLYVDGVIFAKQNGDKIFTFEVPLTGEHTIEARSGSLSDSIHVRKVSRPNPDYVLQAGGIVNWFDMEEMEFPEGYFSIKDSIADITSVPEGLAIMAQIRQKTSEAFGDVAKNVKMPESMQKMINAMPLEGMLKQAGKAITPEMVISLNKALNRIKKPR